MAQLARIPIVPLEYSSSGRAINLELMIDYQNKNMYYKLDQSIIDLTEAMKIKIDTELIGVHRTAFNKDFSTNEPAMNGVASPGTSDTISRGDHVHPTDTTRAALVHTHTKSQIIDFPHSHDNNEIISMDASKLTGMIDIARIPKGAIENLVIVADETARFALTKERVQNGDTVKQNNDGLMFYVKDDTQLSSEAGYEPYTASMASSVPWSGILDKPTTLSGFGITDAEPAFSKNTAFNKNFSDSDPVMNGVASPGTSDTVSRGDHVHPTDTTREPVIIKKTAFNKDFSIVNPVMNGVASPGNSDTISRADHVHPTDTTRAAINHSHNNNDLPPYPTTLPANGGNSDTVDSYHVDDNKNGIDSTTNNSIWTAYKVKGLIDTKEPAIGLKNTAFNKNFSNSDPIMNGVASPGNSDTISRADHVHPTDTTREPAFTKNTAFNKDFSTNEPAMNGAASPGNSDTISRGDHVHPTDTTRAAINHSHDNNEIISMDASKLTGMIDIARIPKGAIENLVIVADETARFTLTKEQAQNGDTVKQDIDGLMFYVKDDTQLSSEAGYEPYTAGAASSVPWSGITDKPTTLSGFGITDGISTNDVVTTPEPNKILRLNENGQISLSIISQDSNSNFVTDTEKYVWNNQRVPKTNINNLLADIGWYRIAQTAINIDLNLGRFELRGNVSNSGLESVIFEIAINNSSKPSISQQLYSYWGVPNISKIRIIYNQAYTGNYAYIEVYNEVPNSSISVDLINKSGWGLITPILGFIPSDYSNIEFKFEQGIKTNDNVNAKGITATNDIKVGNYTLNYNNTTQSIEFLFN